MKIFNSSEFSDFCISIENTKEEYGKSKSFHVHLAVILPSWNGLCKQIIFKENVKTKEDIFERIKKILNKKKTYKELNVKYVEALLEWIYTKDDDLFLQFKSEKDSKELLRTIKELDLLEELKTLVSYIEVKEHDMFWVHRYLKDSPVHEKNFECFLYPKEKDEMKKYILDCLSDIEIKVGDDIYKAHKCIISKSDFLYVYFQSWNNGEKLLKLEDCETKFKTLFEYLYLEKAKFNEETAVDLLFWANKFVLPNLQKDIEKFIEPLITEDTVCSILSVAYTISSTHLKDVSKKFIIQRIIADEKKFKNLFFPQLESIPNLISDLLIDEKKVRSLMNGEISLCPPPMFSWM